MPIARPVRATALLTAAVLFATVAACGGGDDKDATEDSSTTSSSAAASGETSSTTAAGGGGGGTTTPTAVAGDPRTQAQIDADGKLADKVVLTVKDLGSGWTTSSDDDDDDDEDDPSDAVLEDSMRDCMGVDDGFFEDSLVEAESPEFEQGDATVSGSVGVMPTEAVAVGEFDIVSSTKFRGCLQKGFQAQMAYENAHPDDDTPEGMRFEDITVDPLALPQPVGDESVGFRISITASVPGTSFTFLEDLYLVRRGRFEISLSVQQAFGPYAEADPVRWARAMDDRAKAST